MSRGGRRSAAGRVGAWWGGRRGCWYAGVLAFASVWVVVSAGCQMNPATGREQFDYLSREEEIAMGEGAMAEVVSSYGGELGDEVVRAYVAEVGQRVAATVEARYADLPWEFTALGSDEVNAFALPGGKVFITRGLLVEMGSEAELAGVLAHEVAHVTGQHHDSKLGRQLGLAVGAAAVGVAVGRSESEWARLGGQALLTGAGIYALSFDRDQEYESDELGLRYMTRAGYDPRGMVGVMVTLDSLGGVGGPEWASTHPNPGRRVERLERVIGERYLEEAGSLEVGEASYRRNVLSRLR